MSRPCGCLLWNFPPHHHWCFYHAPTCITKVISHCHQAIGSFHLLHFTCYAKISSSAHPQDLSLMFPIPCFSSSHISFFLTPPQISKSPYLLYVCITSNLESLLFLCNRDRWELFKPLSMWNSPSNCLLRTFLQVFSIPAQIQVPTQQHTKQFFLD